MSGSTVSTAHHTPPPLDSDTVGTRAVVVTRGTLGRFVVVAAVVGLWMALGWALHLGAVAYLLTGIPLTIAFQLMIARRAIWSLWVIDARSFRLDRIGVVIALGLACLPLYAAVLGVANGRILDVGYGLAGVAGAAPAAYALRAMGPPARRALVQSSGSAGVVAAALLLINRAIAGVPAMADPLAAIAAFAISLGLYIPMVFVIEEVFFRGALDTYARRGPTSEAASAVFVSLLWGLWHLPLVLREGGLAAVPITLAFHLIVGLLLTRPWRRAGNLAVPGITHALIDAVRDGLGAV
jgi:membrane protease YdiL (CAAX protease family)